MVKVYSRKWSCWEGKISSSFLSLESLCLVCSWLTCCLPATSGTLIVWGSREPRLQLCWWDTIQVIIPPYSCKYFQPGHVRSRRTVCSYAKCYYHRSVRQKPLCCQLDELLVTFLCKYCSIWLSTTFCLVHWSVCIVLLRLLPCINEVNNERVVEPDTHTRFYSCQLVFTATHTFKYSYS